MSVTERRSRLDGRAVALILGCCLIWGLNQVVMKVTLPVIPPLMQGAMRSLIAAAFVGWWARRRGIALWPADGGNRAGVLAGAVFAVEFCCVYWGLQFTTASRATVFLYLAPFVVAIGMPFISASERLRPIQVIGLCLAFGGLAATFHEGFAAGSGAPKGQWLGDLLAVGGAVFWGMTTLIVRASPLSHAAPERTLFAQLAISAPLMGAASWLAGEPAPQWDSAVAWLSMGYQGIVIAFASYLTWFWLLRHYPATRVSAFTFLSPVFGMVAGVVLLGDPLTGALLSGLFGVAMGLVLVNRR